MFTICLLNRTEKFPFGVKVVHLCRKTFYCHMFIIINRINLLSKKILYSFGLFLKKTNVLSRIFWNKYLNHRTKNVSLFYQQNYFKPQRYSCEYQEVRNLICYFKPFKYEILWINYDNKLFKLNHSIYIIHYTLREIEMAKLNNMKKKTTKTWWHDYCTLFYFLIIEFNICFSKKKKKNGNKRLTEKL